MVKHLKIKDLLLGNNTISVVVADAGDYLEMSAKALKELTTKENIPGVYVTINKPYSIIRKKFEKAGFDPKKLAIGIGGIIHTQSKPAVKRIHPAGIWGRMPLRVKRRGRR